MHDEVKKKKSRDTMKLDWPLFSDLCTVNQCITTEERLASDVTTMC